MQVICEREGKRSAEKDSWNILSNRTHCNSRDGFGSHKSAILDPLRCPERHKTSAGQEYLAVISLDENEAHIADGERGAKAPCRPIDQSVLVLPIEGSATSWDPMVSIFQNDAVIELATYPEIRSPAHSSFPSRPTLYDVGAGRSGEAHTRVIITRIQSANTPSCYQCSARARMVHDPPLRSVYRSSLGH